MYKASLALTLELNYLGGGINHGKETKLIIYILYKLRNHMSVTGVD
jgi:hypothetical protein